MVVNNCKVICPKCKAANCYTIVKLDLIDTDLHVTYSCGRCSARYTDVYALVYLGGCAADAEYDRDNITINM